MPIIENPFRIIERRAQRQAVLADSTIIFFSFLGEETLLSALIFSWTGAVNTLPELNEKCWKEIKKAVLLSTDVLHTRNHFAKRWFINTARFFLQTKYFCAIPQVNCDIVITASGPDLLYSLPNIIKNRDSFFVLAVSSSLSVLLKNKIIPEIKALQ